MVEFFFYLLWRRFVVAAETAGDAELMTQLWNIANSRIFFTIFLEISLMKFKFIQEFVSMIIQAGPDFQLDSHFFQKENVINQTSKCSGTKKK